MYLLILHRKSAYHSLGLPVYPGTQTRQLANCGSQASPLPRYERPPKPRIALSRGGYEYPALLGVSAALVLIGPGDWSLDACPGAAPTGPLISPISTGSSSLVVRCAMAATDFVLGRGAPASMITRLALRIIGRSLGWPARRLVVAEPGRPAAVIQRSQQRDVPHL